MNTTNILENAISDDVKKIKKALGNRCFFCENTLEEKEPKDVFFLTFCEICYNKYHLNKELNEKLENGNGTKLKESIRIIKEIFANRCFFCERDYDPKIDGQSNSEELNFLFSLCQTSCSRKYKIIEN